jgi:hypothetical protein
MGTKSRESIYGSSIRASAERAKEARKEADRLGCVAWNQRMLGYKGPAQPSPTLGYALNAGYSPPQLDRRSSGGALRASDQRRSGTSIAELLVPSTARSPARPPAMPAKA